MATNINERVYKISVDGASAIKQLEKIAGSATSIDQRFAKLGTALKGAFAVGTVVVGIKSFTDAIGKAIDEMDEMSKAAQKIGVSVESLSGLKFAAEQSGVAFESLQTGLKKLNQNLFDFDTATDAGAQSLKKFGVLVGDDTTTALGKIADGFESIPDGVQKTATAMAIFGKAGADLIPLLNGGSKSIEELTARAKELGIVFDGVAAKQAELFNDKMSELRTALNGVFIQISTGLLPVLSALTDELTSSVKVGDTWKTVGEGIGEAMLDIAESTIVAIDALASFGRGIAFLAGTAKDLASIRLDPTGDGPANLVKRFQDAFASEPVETAGNKLLETIKRVRERVKEPLDELNKPLRGGAGGGAGGGGKGEKSDLEKWLDGLKKSADELDSIPEKMRILSEALTQLKDSGEEGSSAFKVMSDAYKKLNEETAKGNVGAEIELQVQKIKEEATLTAEKMEYLGTAIAFAFEQGDTEGAQILIDMMDKLKGKTDETADQFKKLGDGIEQAIANNANNAVNSFIDNIGQAELSFTDFATSVIKDIAKIVVQLLIMKPIIDSIKGFIGGFSSGGEVGWEGGFSTRAFAAGGSFSGGTGLAQGVYSQPTLFKFAKGGTFGGNIGVLGEGSGPEAIVPLKRTASGDLGVQASPVNVNVYNNAGVEVKTESSTSSDGTKQIDVYIERKVKDGIANGSYDRAFKGAYGLSRMGA
jgi:lambda family phage tail tape measure protein